MTTTIQVSKDTKQKLKTLKEQYGVNSMDAVIHTLVGLPIDGDAADGASSAEENGGEGEAMHKKKKT